MNWGMYGILVIFGLFVLLLIFNPNLSCFGKRIRSPLHPLFRKKRHQNREAEDYGFHLIDDSSEKISTGRTQNRKIEDYGFSLGEDEKEQELEDKEKRKKRTKAADVNSD